MTTTIVSKLRTAFKIVPVLRRSIRVFGDAPEAERPNLNPKALELRMIIVGPPVFNSWTKGNFLSVLVPGVRKGHAGEIDPGAFWTNADLYGSALA